MSLFPDPRPQLRIVNSAGTAIEGPYYFDAAPGASAPATLGINLRSLKCSEEAEKIDFKNFQWADVSYILGYRYHVTMDFEAVEHNGSATNYGLTLLHRLWRAAAETQVPYGALQFARSTGATFYPVVQESEWQPADSGGKWGRFDVSLSFKTRSLVATPGEWAVSLW